MMYSASASASGCYRKYFKAVLTRLVAHEGIAEPKEPVATTQASTVGPSTKNSPHAQAYGRTGLRAYARKIPQAWCGP